MGRRINKREIIKKLASILLCFVLVILINFFLPRELPGDPVLMLTGIEKESMSDGQYEMYYKKLGLGDPIIVQFTNYVKGVFSLDFGYSYHHESEVSTLIFERIARTLKLAIPVFLLSSILAFILGLNSGERRGEKIDKGLTFLNILTSSFPSFFIAMILLLVLAFKLKLFPLGGLSSYYNDGILGQIWHLTLPVLALTISSIPQKFLLARNLTAGEMGKDYVSYNKTRGLSKARQLYVHIGRNVLLPYLASLSVSFGYILSGSMVVESVFSIYGMGNLMYKSVMLRDFPTLQGCLFVSACMVLFSQLVFEIISFLLIRKSEGGRV